MAKKSLAGAVAGALFNESKHRRGNAKNKGQFASKGGGDAKPVPKASGGIKPGSLAEQRSKALEALKGKANPTKAEMREAAAKALGVKPGGAKPAPKPPVAEPTGKPKPKPKNVPDNKKPSTKTQPLPSAPEPYAVPKGGVEHPTNKNLRVFGGTTKVWAARMDAAHQKLPPNIRAITKDTKIETPWTLSEARPDLFKADAGGPRGHSAGYNTVGGLFFGGKDNAITIPQMRLNPLTNSWVENERPEHIFFHEIAHAYDDGITKVAGKRLTETKEYLTAYLTDLKAMAPEHRKTLGYFLQDPPAGPQEAFAEAFAEHFHPGGPSYNVGKHMPNVRAFVEKHAKG